MDPLRRAVLRSAASAAVASRASVVAAVPRASPMISQAVRRTANVNLAAVAAARTARYFSQTARVREEPTEKVVAETTESAAEEVTEKPAAPTTAADSQNQSGDATPYGVFIRNVVFDASEQHLQEAFQHYGTVVRTVIARDARGLSRGFAFVFFETAEAQQKAIEEANGSFWHGRRIVVQQRTPRELRQPRESRDASSSSPSREPTNSLYIGNLPYETTDADLNHLFRDLEGLVSVRVAVDRSTGWPRGFAHADFVEVAQAIKAVEALIGQTVGTRQLRIDYADPAQKASARTRRE